MKLESSVAFALAVAPVVPAAADDGGCRTHIFVQRFLLLCATSDSPVFRVMYDGGAGGVGVGGGGSGGDGGGGCVGVDPHLEVLLHPDAHVSIFCMFDHPSVSHAQ